MNYIDEESRLIFHKSKSLLQLVCQMFESFCFLQGKVPEFVDLLDEDTAILGIDEVTPEQAEDIVEKVNLQFRRGDEFVTCKIMSPDLNLFQIFVTGSSDFKNVN